MGRRLWLHGCVASFCAELRRVGEVVSVVARHSDEREQKKGPSDNDFDRFSLDRIVQIDTRVAKDQPLLRVTPAKTPALEQDPERDGDDAKHQRAGQNQVADDVHVGIRGRSNHSEQAESQQERDRRHNREQADHRDRIVPQRLDLGNVSYGGRQYDGRRGHGRRQH